MRQIDTAPRLVGSLNVVFITGRGRPAHVLLTIDDYRRLADGQANIAELLSQPEGVGEIEFDPPRSRETGTPATFS